MIKKQRMVIKPILLVLLGCHICFASSAQKYIPPAGKQLLWASSQIHAVLSPLSVNDSNFDKCKEVVLKNKPIITSKEKQAELKKTALI